MYFPEPARCISHILQCVFLGLCEPFFPVSESCKKIRIFKDNDDHDDDQAGVQQLPGGRQTSRERLFGHAAPLLFS